MQNPRLDQTLQESRAEPGPLQRIKIRFAGTLLQALLNKISVRFQPSRRLDFSFWRGVKYKCDHSSSFFKIFLVAFSTNFEYLVADEHLRSYRQPTQACRRYQGANRESEQRSR